MPTAPWLAPLGMSVASPAIAQTSGGYSQPSEGGSFGGYGGYGGFDRRPALGGGGFGELAGSPFGGFGLDSSRGGDRAISGWFSSQALQDCRASQTRLVPPPLSATRRPSTGWDDNSWGAATSPRRYPAGRWTGGYAPDY